MMSRILFGLLLSAIAGCGLIQSPPSGEDPKPEKTYKGLAGQTCAVMVYADWQTRVNYSQIQGDLAKAVQQRLQKQLNGDSENKDKKPAGPQTQFLNPLSVVRYQREHPETEAMPIAEVAPKLGVGRLVYVELNSFSSQSPDSIMILKGLASATLRVLDIANGKATVAFEETGVEAHYPPDAPEGVAPSDKYSFRTVYNGTIEKLAERLASRFAE